MMRKDYEAVASNGWQRLTSRILDYKLYSVLMRYDMQHQTIKNNIKGLAR